MDVITIRGHISDVTFEITGPISKVDAIRNFIRNLTRMHGGVHHIDKDKIFTENAVTRFLNKVK